MNETRCSWAVTDFRLADYVHRCTRRGRPEFINVGPGRDRETAVFHGAGRYRSYPYLLHFCEVDPVYFPQIEVIRRHLGKIRSGSLKWCEEERRANWTFRGWMDVKIHGDASLRRRG